MFRIYGNRGAYVMPESPVFDNRADAMDYRNKWWPDNRYVHVIEDPEFWS